MLRFAAAPWSRALVVVSTLGTVVLAGAGVSLLLTAPASGDRLTATFGTLLLAVPVLVLLGGLLFVVRGYELEPGGLRIERLLWSTRLPLQGLERAWHDPDAMRRSLRLFGNGGLFSISGLFRNPTLGSYRAFVTDPKRAVVLRCTGRTVVVSPASPEAFLEELRQQQPGATLEPPPAR